jgi:Nucleotidyltransferase domain/Domain of unknown function (DUF4111)
VVSQLPDGAAGAIDRYLDAADSAVPDLVVGLHVVGSLALGDYRPERSDIDVVAVVAREPDSAQRSLLAEIHRVVATRVDGPYLTADALRRDPQTVGAVAHHVDGVFELGPCHEVSPVTWAILADDAITMRGKSPRELGVCADHDAVRAFAAANLREYWAGWARAIGAVLEKADNDDTIEARMLEWGVLGAARVHVAWTSGRVVSKLAAGDYARSTFGPEWHDVVDLAIASRRGERDEVRVHALRRACAFVRAISDSRKE